MAIMVIEGEVHFFGRYNNRGRGFQQPNAYSSQLPQSHNLQQNRKSQLRLRIHSAHTERGTFVRSNISSGTKCYNCEDFGLYGRDCLKPPRKSQGTSMLATSHNANAYL